MSLGLRIKNLRQQKNITQTELGNYLDVQKSTISMYENNKSNPDLETIKKIANYFNVTVDYLLGNETEKPKLSKKDEKDIAKEMGKLREKLEKEGGLMFNGEVLDDETRELLLIELERQEKIIKLTNKKYIPKKYR